MSEGQSWFPARHQYHEILNLGVVVTDGRGSEVMLALSDRVCCGWQVNTRCAFCWVFLLVDSAGFDRLTEIDSCLHIWDSLALTDSRSVAVVIAKPKLLNIDEVWQSDFQQQRVEVNGLHYKFVLWSSYLWHKTLNYKLGKLMFGDYQLEDYSSKQCVWRKEKKKITLSKQQNDTFGLTCETNVPGSSQVLIKWHITASNEKTPYSVATCSDSDS